MPPVSGRGRPLPAVGTAEERGASRCILCGEADPDRVARAKGAPKRQPHWFCLHRRCECRLKKIEAEELHALYESLEAVRERCNQLREENIALKRDLEAARASAVR